MYLQYYLMGIILVPGLLFAIYAQTKVSSTYNKYNQVFANSNITSAQLLKVLASTCNMNYLKIKQIPGQLSDNYNPITEEISLSSSNYDSSTISALGVACHEFGHALQKKERYAPYQVRRILIPITNIASTLLWPLVIIGLIFNFGVEAGGILGDIFLWAGIGFFGIAVLLNLATLPVEYNASSRALNILKSTRTLNEEELSGAKQVLDAAALTYVAALVVSVLNLLRFLAFIFLSRDRR